MKCKTIIQLLTAFLAIIFFHWESTAQITVPKVFGDNMVLQRDIQIPVWGNASPGTNVIVELGAEKVNTITGEDGKWMIHFPEFKAGGPYSIKIYEPGKPELAIEFKNILIGDVWLASGQSNMEWQVQQAHNAKNEIANANYPQIRVLFVEHDKKLLPQQDILAGSWKICDTLNVKQFSAIAYYFARKIHLDNNVPVGIVQSTWGGTPVESWTSRETLLSSPLTKIKVHANDTLTQNHFVQDSLNLLRFWDIVYNPQNNSATTIPSPEYNDSAWAAIEMPKVIKDFGIGRYEGMVWLRKKVTLPESFIGKELSLHMGHVEMNYSIYFNGTEICKTVWNASPSHSYTIPGNNIKNTDNTISLRIAMLWGGGGINAPADSIYITDGITKIPLASTWLYKKDLEPTIPKIRNYHYYPEVLFNAMINPLVPFGIKGFIWYQGEADDSVAFNYRKTFPMMIADWRQHWGMGDLPFLYVQLANFKKIKDIPSESEWAELREAQTLTLSQPNTGMACIIDIGEADNIHPANKQEVGRRLALIANKKVYGQNCIASGPIYNSYLIEGNKIRIRFTNTGSELSTFNNQEVLGFAIAGDDKQFHWAKAIIEGNEVVVYSEKVAKPVAVRYAWADNPVCNLVNTEGLPTVPFRTDDWNGITQK